MSASGLQLRDYQAECIDIIDNLDGGAHLVQMATGLGKTVTFANIHRHGRMLILSHRDELVAQPVKYFDCPVGIEKAGRHSNGEPVVSGSVQTLSRGTRLQRNFKPGDFDLIVTDEAHHALAPTYQKIVDYLQPRLHIGFTATPNRGDGRGLDDVFEDIVFQRDLLWGIRHGYLCDIDCMQVEVEWSTKGVKRVAGDFQLSALNDAVNRPKSNAQVAEAYRQFHRGQTLIFASSVKHAYALAELIEGAVVVDGKTPMDERRQIIEDFTARKIPVLINFGVFTEGTDMPLIETVLLARPTRNSTLYTQMVGRGLRLYEDPATGYRKKDLLLIDCVGDSDKNDICTAPSLIGIDPSELDENEQKAVRGPLSGMRDRIAASEDTPEGWVLSVRKVDLTASSQNIAWIRRADGSKVIRGKGWSVRMHAPDILYRVKVDYIGTQKSTREYDSEEIAEGVVRRWLDHYPIPSQDKSLWDTEFVRKWGNKPASSAQVGQIRRMLGDDAEEIDVEHLTKREAAAVLDNAFEKQEKVFADMYGLCPKCGQALKLTKNKKSFTCTSNHWSKDGAWTLISGCGTTFKVRADGHCIKPADLQAIQENGFYVWRGKKYAFEPARNLGSFSSIRCIGEADEDSR